MISSDHSLYFPFDLLLSDQTDVDSTLRIEEEVIAPLEAPKPIVSSAPSTSHLRLLSPSAPQILHRARARGPRRFFSVLGESRRRIFLPPLLPLSE
jgi:hypothetical protein